MNLTEVMEGLVEEKGLDKNLVIDIICEAICAVYKKKYPHKDITVSFNQKTSNIDILTKKAVVAHVENKDKQVSLRKAQIIYPRALIGEIVDVPFDEPIGRIEILTAKQIIAKKIVALEQIAVYTDFKDKKNTIISGLAHKRERGGWVVKVGENLCFLPKENAIPGEELRVGMQIKCLVRDVLKIATSGYQVILDRASCFFVEKLLELEIPEIFEGIVEIKSIARAAGYKTKAVVVSSSKEIDPVGTCVGLGGARIKPILREINNEKIDLIEYTPELEDMVKNSLKPAEIDRVQLVDEQKALVWLAQDQRSLAIGKMGKNIALASKIVGVPIQLQDIGGQKDTEVF